MNIKITPGPKTAPLSSTKKAGETKKANDISSDQITSDPVSQIALEVINGILTPSQAVDRLIEHTMKDGVVKTIDQDLRQELEELLKDAVKTDKTLSSLIARLE